MVNSHWYDAHDMPMICHRPLGCLFSRKKMRLAFGGFVGMLSGRSGSGCNFMPFFNFLILGWFHHWKMPERSEKVWGKKRCLTCLPAKKCAADQVHMASPLSWHTLRMCSHFLAAARCHFFLPVQKGSNRNLQSLCFLHVLLANSTSKWLQT